MVIPYSVIDHEKKWMADQKNVCALKINLLGMYFGLTPKYSSNSISNRYHVPAYLLRLYSTGWTLNSGWNYTSD